jgi:hypothetical protein
VANLKQLAQASLGFVGLPRFALNQDMYMYIWEAGTICIHKSPTNFVTITCICCENSRKIRVNRMTEAPNGLQTAVRIPRLDPRTPDAVLARSRPPRKSNLRQEDVGRFSVDEPLPCDAYCFMLPFPFLCLGCFIFGASKLTFDDTTMEVTAKRWDGLFERCAKIDVIPYHSIANVVIVGTNMRVNHVRQKAWGLLLTDGSVISASKMGFAPQEAAERALEIHYHLFGRANPDYQAPNPASLMVA